MVLNVATTYGARDLGPTPQGDLVRAAARGRMPAYVRSVAMEVVGIEDAARAFVLAAERGRTGERYIIFDRYVSTKDVLTLAARATGARPPWIGIPLPAMKLAGLVDELVGRVGRFDPQLSSTSVRLMHVVTALDHRKATRELGWEPRPTVESIREAALYLAAG